MVKVIHNQKTNGISAKDMLPGKLYHFNLYPDMVILGIPHITLQHGDIVLGIMLPNGLVITNPDYPVVAIDSDTIIIKE